MAKPYDAVVKHLIETHPEDWLALLGMPGLTNIEPVDVELLDTDLSTVTSQADRILKINTPSAILQHIELETGHHGAQTPDNLLLFSTLVRRKFDLPVRSAVVLLRREADSPRLNGLLEYEAAGETYLQFRYGIVRVWELSADDLLSGGLGTLPLAPIAKVEESRLPEIIRRMQSRVDAEVADNEIGEFWTSTNILLGLRYSRSLSDILLKGVLRMRESVTYQAILEEGEARGEARGRAEEARRILLLVGSPRLGRPSEQIMTALTNISSIERLEEMAVQLSSVESWDDLLSS